MRILFHAIFNNINFFLFAPEAANRSALKKKVLLKIFRISPVLESLCNKVAGLTLETCHFIKKSLQQRFFPLNIAKFLNTAFLIEHLKWSLLLLSTQISNSLTSGVPKSSYLVKQT